MARQRASLRVLDVNLNRAREGLRVCEEVARLVLESPALTRRIQRVRYDLAKLSADRSKLLKARDAAGDVGRPALRKKSARHRSYRDLVLANSQRIQEALRVLEEFSRLESLRASQSFAGLRFRVYSLEQDLLKRL